MTLPLQEISDELQSEDLGRFAINFTKTVTDFLPCDAVSLLPVATSEELAETNNRWRDGVEAVRRQQKPCVDAVEGEQIVFLPLWSNGELFAVAVLAGCDSAICQASEDWLLEQSMLISREFLLIKQYSIDPVTGLLNGGHLRTELQAFIDATRQGAQGDDESEQEVAGCSLVLIEISPRGRSAERGLSYITRAGSYLDSVLGHSSPLHHFGSGIFCQLWQGVDVDSARKMGDVLLRKLRREDFSQGHLGITALDRHDLHNEISAEQCLEQAWEALRTARQRGPFALCAHSSAADLETHPLKPPSVSALKWFKRLWRGEKSFAVVILRQDQEAASNHFSKRISSLLGRQRPFQLLNQREAYVYLNGATEAEALTWAHDFKEKMKSLGGATFSMGLAVYPCLNFNKSDMPLNARKALVHAGFLGPDAMAVFDGVSLNISGDVYYNEGDLRKALKEYKKGLALDPENLNLLNSIGVAYAQMNRPKMAIPFFERVLELDVRNFMALFNMGFACLTLKKIPEAIVNFERALAEDDQHFDLLSQLGKLYCQVGRYEDAVRLLAKCVSSNGSAAKREIDYGVVHRYLGEAYKALGENQQAMTHLQKAVSVNAQYPGALSMLGELYALEGEGDDIALSLCRQAVELDDSRAEYWYRLGWVQSRLGEKQEAIASLQKSMRCDRKNVPAAFLLGRLYEKLGQRRRAKQMYDRVLRLDPDHRKSAAIAGGAPSRFRFVENVSGATERRGL